ncbi:MAG TPA: transcriptional regulator GcvA [Burkholderiaceae bacterium]|nr:transcriptional regulator GcvA [Burkholderiaceae bacterium]
MRRLCPSLSELLAFEAAARHLSFTRAAECLGVTQGAISRQVRQLEEFLGLELFQRIRKRLVLTDGGHAYYARVQPSLDQLQAATLEVVSYRNGGGTLSLSVLPGFNAKWLLSRLPRFGRKNANIALNFIPSPPSEDLWHPTLDAAIRYGDGIWPQSISDYLIGKRVVPVCSPKLLEGSRPIRQPKDLVRHTLLQNVHSPRAWTEWLDACGVKGINGLKGLRLDNFSVQIQATVAGLGVALVPEFLVADELERGTLVVPFDTEVTSSYGYYLVYPEEKRNLPPLHAFRAWLLREVALTEAQLRRTLHNDDSKSQELDELAAEEPNSQSERTA